MINKILANLIIISCVTVTLAICYRVFRLKSSERELWLSPIDITIFNRLNRSSSLIVVVLMVGTGLIWYRLLHYISLLQVYWSEGTIYGKPVGSDVLLLLTFFLSFASSIILQAFLYKLILGRKFNRYVYSASSQAGFDLWRANVTISVLLLLVFMAIALLATNSYVKVTSNDLVINEPFSLRETRYGFVDISSIKQINHLDQSESNSMMEIYFVFDFTNGESWRTNSYKENMIPEDLHNIILFASEHSEKKIQSIDE